MKAKSIHADQLDFQDTAAYHPQTNEFSLLPGFISFYQDAAADQARSASGLRHAAQPSCAMLVFHRTQDIATHLAKMYREYVPEAGLVARSIFNTPQKSIDLSGGFSVRHCLT